MGERFIRIPMDLYISDAYRVLTPSAIVLANDMVRAGNYSKEVHHKAEFRFSFGMFVQVPALSERTFRRAMEEVIRVGIVEPVRVTIGASTTYRLSDAWKGYQPTPGEAKELAKCRAYNLRQIGTPSPSDQCQNGTSDLRQIGTPSPSDQCQNGTSTHAKLAYRVDNRSYADNRRDHKPPSVRSEEDARLDYDMADIQMVTGEPSFNVPEWRRRVKRVTSTQRGRTRFREVLDRIEKDKDRRLAAGRGSAQIKFPGAVFIKDFEKLELELSKSVNGTKRRPVMAAAKSIAEVLPNAIAGVVG